jgi:ligand-binding SRPBCC domain-containing protein
MNGTAEHQQASPTLVRPRAPIFHLHRSVELPAPLACVFPFFADPFNLELLTPLFLRFRILTPEPINMAVGVRIDYALRVHGIPLRWTSEITVWEPPHRFVDVQVKGPYRWWRHEHRFEELGTTTGVTDEVEYAPMGGRIINALFVRRDIERIFEFRRLKLMDLFGHGAPSSTP